MIVPSIDIVDGKAVQLVGGEQQAIDAGDPLAVLERFAVAGTVAVIWVGESTRYVAAVPLNATEVAPVRFVPVMTTLVPGGPLVGVKVEMVGGWITVKVPALSAGPPPAVVTCSAPVVAPAGTVAVICLALSTT